ncbi:Do family serine endopeptidase [Rhodoplanes sp. TEM]|uniref:Do family serine endopeptidase n=1 Tax=Rhodoplanes tepidamans TaxID=200616 RepID=A0ABT5JG33_RHOTP|nr:MULTISPECIES: Do family serine endopeptidase [Rhodoplanes]MDC7788668.1 Do family serine endopeptidase [Rhodoplanes tepidamans]MDC7984402.1 Do family serine endopeptidase [Rhodoplanes sp. TEM]MDQ0358328.1 serine protease Do [Rhodoplanes tepidamans]
MIESQPLKQKARSIVSARRLALLATVGALGAGVLFVNPDFVPGSRQSALLAPAHAQTQNAQRPAGFADIVDKVKPAVISVKVKVSNERPRVGTRGEEDPFGPGSPFEFFFRRFGQPDGMPDQPRQRRRQFSTGQGSGFFITPDGYAVTNNHVVDKAESVQVTTDDGKTYTAKVIGTDPRTDLALIKVEGRTDFPAVALGDKAPRIGDWVLAVGNPFGLGGTVTAGIVSARGRDIGAGPYDDFLQIDAPVNRGNSGGPSFDMDGNVVGVNTAIFSPSGGSVGIAFAIPAETVRTVVAQLKDKGQVTRGWIGVQIQPVTADIADSLGLKAEQGALVAEPQSGSPAAKAGIRSGDVITAVNGEPVKDARTLARTIGTMAPGASVKLDVFRKGKTETMTLTLGELPKERVASRGDDDGERGGRGGDTKVPRLGLTLAPAGSVAGGGSDGVVVTQVDPDGAAGDRLKTGDVILDVGGATVNSPADVRKALAEAQTGGKKTVLMRVKTGQNTRFVAVPLGKG